MKKTLAQPLTNDKINDIWRAGFCAVLVEHARLTEVHESKARIDFLRKHVKTCVHCYNANILKAVEHEVARTLGPEAAQVFNNGGDISTQEGFSEVLHARLDELMESGAVDEDFVKWMASIALRATQDYIEQKGEDA